jgi:hypothetical protein
VGIRTADWSRLGLREELREELRVRSVQPLAAHVDSGTSLHAPCAAGGALSRAGICACRSRSWRCVCVDEPPKVPRTKQAGTPPHTGWSL